MKNRAKEGYIAEQKFVLQSLKEGFIISQPLFSQQVYDFILEYKGKLNKVQIKSTLRFDETYKRYSLTASKRDGKVYSKEEIDFLIAILPNENYYIIPVENLKSKAVRIYEKHTRQIKNIKTGMYEEYLNRWDLLK